MTWAFEDSSTNWEARKSSYYCEKRWARKEEDEYKKREVIGPITNRRLMIPNVPL